MGFKNIKGEFNRTGLIADFISGKYVGNSAKKVFGKIGPPPLLVNYLVVAGGGSGGAYIGGGGGAGGYR